MAYFPAPAISWLHHTLSKQNCPRHLVGSSKWLLHVQVFEKMAKLFPQAAMPNGGSPPQQ